MTELAKAKELIIRALRIVDGLSLEVAEAISDRSKDRPEHRAIHYYAYNQRLDWHYLLDAIKEGRIVVAFPIETDALPLGMRSAIGNAGDTPTHTTTSKVEVPPCPGPHTDAHASECIFLPESCRNPGPSCKAADERPKRRSGPVDTVPAPEAKPGDLHNNNDFIPGGGGGP